MQLIHPKDIQLKSTGSPVRTFIYTWSSQLVLMPVTLTVRVRRDRRSSVMHLSATRTARFREQVLTGSA